MAKQKKSRNKKYSPIRSRVSHIGAVLNTAVNKFYMVGDMNHGPQSFHLSDIKMNLKPDDARIALGEMCEFFYGQPRTWALGVYHFFNIDGKIEVIPTVLKMEDILLNEFADQVDEQIETVKQAILDPEEGYTEESHIFYGYYINYGDNLSWDAMEGEIIGALMKVNNDLQDINPEVVPCNAEKVLFAIAGEKFSITNSNAIKSELEEVRN